MATLDLLQTLAEVSVAFVGFSTVVAVLSSETDAFRFYSIRDVAVVGLLALAASVIPFLLLGYFENSLLAWRLSCLIFSVLWIVSAFFGIRSFRRNVDIANAPKYLNVGPIATVVGIPVLIWNGFFPNDYTSVTYTFVLVGLLAFVGASFLAATFHGRESGD